MDAESDGGRDVRAERARVEVRREPDREAGKAESSGGASAETAAQKYESRAPSTRQQALIYVAVAAVFMHPQ